ncbi:hypothetical protein SARC_02491 [Sphaeroforma arctica JP610]|uniref:Uncharacterized protein n=1 Tax=Sphaeroforma arctica JP610 TaxID=667725 RepID=A0A0L0GAM5_9EUKA|nr:hypothetical protein SARC_02491 [Sphaeroforma arctica JP610]KNC85308.1 hypothetical protein SARC_02491 [Sphaeroforma arctica JP610]|eukprot:XP_014159210.1 hypothetical protein SARC_02491 [Sphaeroforma arctica JP610]
MVILSMSAAQNLAAIRQMTSGSKEGRKSKSISLWKTVKLFFMPTRAVRSKKVDYGPKTHSEGFRTNNNCYVMVPILEGDNGNLGWAQVGTWYGEYSGIVLQRMIVERNDFESPHIWHVDSGIPMDLVFSHLTEECLAGYKALSPDFTVEEFLTKWSDEFKPDSVQCINKYQLLAKMGSSRHNGNESIKGRLSLDSAERKKTSDLGQEKKQGESTMVAPQIIQPEKALVSNTGSQIKQRVIVKLLKKGEDTKGIVVKGSMASEHGMSCDDSETSSNSTDGVNSWLASTAYCQPVDKRRVGTFETTFHEVQREGLSANNRNYTVPVAIADTGVNKFIQMNNHAYKAKNIASCGDYATQSGYINQSANLMVLIPYLERS